MTATLTTKSKINSVEDYFAIETRSEATDGIRREYRNGEIIDMTGGTTTHNQLTLALVLLVKSAAKANNAQVFSSDVRLWIPSHNTYTYPDVMVVPQPIQLQEGRKDTVLNPLLIAEVLSASTRSYDRIEKFAAYRSIPSFREYLLVDQYQPYVEHFIRQQAGEWIFRAYDAGTVSLSSLGLGLHLEKLYEDIEFNKPDGENQFP